MNPGLIRIHVLHTVCRRLHLCCLDANIRKKCGIIQYLHILTWFIQWAPKVLGQWVLWIWNDTMTKIKVQTVSFNLRVFSSISGEPFRNYSTFHSPPILGDQKHWDKLTYVYQSCQKEAMITSNLCHYKLVGCFCCLFCFCFRLFCAQYYCNWGEGSMSWGYDIKD